MFCIIAQTDRMVNIFMQINEVKIKRALDIVIEAIFDQSTKLSGRSTGKAPKSILLDRGCANASCIDFGNEHRLRLQRQLELNDTNTQEIK